MGAAPDPDRPTLVFDDDCAFCSRCVAWLAVRWSAPPPAVVGSGRLSDDDLSALGLSRPRVLAEVCWSVPGPGGPVASGGSVAVAAALRATRGWSRLAGSVMSYWPLSALTAAAYPLAARHRHRLPGATPACRVDR